MWRIRRTFEKTTSRISPGSRFQGGMLAGLPLAPSHSLAFPAHRLFSCSSLMHLKKPLPRSLWKIRQPLFMYVCMYACMYVCMYWQPLLKTAGTQLEGKGAVSHLFSTHCCEPAHSDFLLSPVQTSCTGWGILKRKGGERNALEHSVDQSPLEKDRLKETGLSGSEAL